MSQSVASEHFVEHSLPKRAKPTMAAAILLGGAAAICVLAGQPVWAAFAGWAAYFTRGSTLRNGAYNLACAVTGLGLGIVALAAKGGLLPDLGLMALPVALLLAIAGIYLMKLMTGVDNMPSYLIGVLVVLASGLEPSLDSYLILTAAVTVGAFAAAIPDIVKQLWRSNDAETEAGI